MSGTLRIEEALMPSTALDTAPGSGTTTAGKSPRASFRSLWKPLAGIALLLLLLEGSAFHRRWTL